MSYFISDKDKERILRSKGLHDKNGFPILDPPGSRNRMTKRCHDQLHQFKTVSDTIVPHEVLYYRSNGRELHQIVKECTMCGHKFTEQRWL